MTQGAAARSFSEVDGRREEVLAFICLMMDSLDNPGSDLAKAIISCNRRMVFVMSGECFPGNFAEELE